MDLKSVVTYFRFSKEQSAGVLSLFVVVIVLQFCNFYLDFGKDVEDDPNKQSWMANQIVIDSLKNSYPRAVHKVYPFNPNFISDDKGYRLGMSIDEIDRLLAYRKLNKYVNSADEFQKVTLVSDSLLRSISPYFKFPDWVKNKKFSTYKKYENHIGFAKTEKIVLKDINSATPEDLIKVYGVGQVLSERIIKLRETVGGIISMDQMNDVWGLSPDVIDKIKLSFKVITIPVVKKIDINNASVKELGQFLYFKNGLAREIVIYRSMNGDFTNIEDLTKIKGFPVEKRNIIALYLEFR
ncbi:MAG: helix-hairpin-helix domain-containing protein [Flavobacteriaceae bacterium]|nr:helix-hairpin-helix domain-containing protein [Flavobacteriaceae bacterium]